MSEPAALDCLRRLRDGFRPTMNRAGGYWHREVQREPMTPDEFAVMWALDGSPMP